MSQQFLERRVWTEEEDEELLRAVSREGYGMWVEVARSLERAFPGISRSGKQCRQRYCNHLDPNIKRSDWDQEQTQQFVALWFQHGNKWTKISELMPGRTESALKNFYYSNLKRAARLLNQRSAEGANFKQITIEMFNHLGTEFPGASRSQLMGFFLSLLELGNCTKHNTKQKDLMDEKTSKSILLLKQLTLPPSETPTFLSRSKLTEETLKESFDSKGQSQKQQPANNYAYLPEPRQEQLGETFLAQARQFRRVESVDLGRHALSPLPAEQLGRPAISPFPSEGIKSMVCSEPNSFVKFLQMGDSQFAHCYAEMNLSLVLNNSFIRDHPPQ